MSFGLVTFAAADGPRVGVLAAEQIADAEPALVHLLGPRPTMRQTLDRWDDALPHLRDFSEWVEWHSVTGRIPLTSARLLAPLPQPRSVHIARAGVASPAAQEPPSAPLPTDAVRGPAAPLVLPAGVDGLACAGALAVVIGRPGRTLARYDTLSVVAGYTLGALSWPVGARRGGNGLDSLEEGQGRGPALGPALIPAECLTDPRASALEMRVNGSLRAATPVADLIAQAGELIGWLSREAGVEPGDVLVLPAAAGAAPAVPLTSGDMFDVTIAEFGALRQRVTRAG